VEWTASDIDLYQSTTLAGLSSLSEAVMLYCGMNCLWLLNVLDHLQSSNSTGCFKKSRPLKLFGIFSLRLSLFAWNFANLLAIHIHIYLPIFCTFILKFHQMALIFPWVPIIFTASSFEYWMQTLREQGLDEKAIISSYTLTKGESWALLRKSAVESTTLAQPFCVNQAVGLGDLPQRLHARFVVLRQFSHW